ncbi:aminotransferase class I/II-fold pyridoxal phosphate-dependent enzyme [Sutcliffiella deserti]|uniref:aminotransferase class I/II-fold pyridoxal phosphate-dependent enzyme n=1 Tax=Sutcliffiella deserti TaxID=2875501 RepID=UPI001CBD985F|nr:aminotransferase class I/II-fold pyridoxal phosphate-dependent enzyme [Sutcliffiella deserti]
MMKQDQTRTPLFSTLRKHWESGPLTGHVPGHKFGTVFPERGLEYFEDILKIDATEITGLDDLHDPEEMIKDAQELAAGLYGSEATYFLVNGSTVGNLAMILATCTRKSRVLVQRNCHKSILNAVELAGAEPVFLPCLFDDELGVVTSISTEGLKQALESISNIDAVILTNPNYYGLSIDLEEIIGMVHEKNLPILVDEAHGAHFVAGDPFPKSALALGADMVVHSAHKTLPAMTMGSFLHVQGDIVKKEKVAYYLRMLQSSSPSYPIMASLDLARFYLASIGPEDIKVIVRSIDMIKDEIDQLVGIKVIRPANPYIKVDPLKLVLRSTNGFSGFELQKALEKEGVFVELADAMNVLFILPLAALSSKHDMIERIKKALNKCEKQVSEVKVALDSFIPFPRNLSQLTIPLDEQQNYQCRKCRLEEAVGEVAAESIIPYPPGISILLKGELITKEVVEYISYLRMLGARFQGNDLLKTNYITTYIREKE